MKKFSFSTARVLFEHPLTLAAQGELYSPLLDTEISRTILTGKLSIV